ncbi:Sucrase/ferredoxin-like-domain-containing protein [Umbelopsis sp. PMI_123]|nr:Sucrase/ferredoxin-like-domain-containing protein [Umbelopsis sp. PMI_123]
MSGIFSALKTAISRSGSPDDSLPPSNILLTQEELCLACPDPCHDHQQFPSYLKIDNTTPLLGSTKPYSRHVLIATGKSDWLSHIDEENGTVAAALLSHMNKVSPPFRILTTNTSLTATHSTLPGSTDVVVLPDNILVSNVTTSNVAQFYDLFLATPLPSKADSALPDLKGNTELVVTKNIYTSMILLCSHRRRDKRCGVTAPILAQEFDHVLRQRDIHEGEGGTALVMVSHIGGHKFAGNIILYTNEGRRGIWYGRVNPCHCEAIVDQSLIGGKVIKELYRGSMTHSFDDEKTSAELQW